MTNTGDKAFDFTASLHSYFAVDDVETATVRGLQGLEYLDRVRARWCLCWAHVWQGRLRCGRAGCLSRRQPAR